MSLAGKITGGVYSSTDLEIDFAKTICTFDEKIMKKTGQKD
jgi:hypothetical protein